MILSEPLSADRSAYVCTVSTLNEWDLHYEWSAWQDEFCMRFSQCPEGGRHRVCMRVGEPAATIVKEAQAVAAELIVLSWKGSFAEGHGAVVKTLLDTAPCPLLIVPAG